MYRVQFFSRNDNEWVAHSVNDTRSKAMKELFFLESTGKKVRIIHNGRIIAISEDEDYELPY